MRLGIIFPSRGLAFSETVEELLREASSAECEWQIFFAHSLPIPECFNAPVRKALALKCTHFWFVEDDMVLPVGILNELISANVPAIGADYPVSESSNCVLYDDDGKVMTIGTGCLLLDRETLLKVYPFSTDFYYDVSDPWSQHPIPDSWTDVYGLHDIHMAMTLYRLGTPIQVTKTMCSQRVVSRLGTPKQNALGWHDISILPLNKE